MERCDSAVRWTGDVKLAVLNFVIRQNHLQKFRKDARSFFEEQLIIWRGGSDDDVSALLGFCAEVAGQDTVYGVHVLRTAAEGQNGGICLCRIVTVGKNYLVLNGGLADLFRFFQQFRL